MATSEKKIDRLLAEGAAERVFELASAGEEKLKRTLYVGGLSEEVDEGILQAAFIPFGDIRAVEIPKDRTTGGHRGFGFVEYEELDDALEAVKNMDKAELFGRTLRVNHSRTGAHAPGSGGKAVWHDDVFFRQEMKKHALELIENFESTADESRK